MVILILVKSTCKRSTGAVDTIGCRGTIDQLPSCCKQHEQDFRDFCTWLVIPSHQKCSCSKDRVWSRPWWPASWWHPFRVATCSVPLGTMKSRRSSVLHIWASSGGTRPPWWIVKNSVDSVRSVYLLHWGACSAKKHLQICLLLCFQPVWHCTSHVKSSLLALAQSVTCISTNGHPAVQLILLVPNVGCLQPWLGHVLWVWSCHSQGNSIKDRSHCFWVQPSSNLAKHICNPIVMPLLVF